MSLETQIAVVCDALAIPLPPKRRCSYPYCKTPLAQSNKGDKCYRHQELEMSKRLMDRTGPATVNELGSGIFRAMKAPRKRKIVAPPQPEPVVEPITQEEVTPMSEPKQEAYRECAVVGCDIALAPQNTTGRCQGHYRLRRGMQMKDGSVPRRHTKLSQQMAEARAKNAATGKTRTRIKKTLPAPTMLATTEEIATKEEIANGADKTVALNVPESALDHFLLRMDISDKIRVVEREIFGAAEAGGR